MSERGKPIADFDAERAVVGALLLDRQAVYGAMAEGLEATDFADPRARATYDACVAVARQRREVDITAVAGLLTDAGDFDRVGGPKALVEYTEAVATSANVEHHARRVRSKARVRRLVDQATRIAKEAHSATDPDAFVVKSQHAIVSLTDATAGGVVEDAASWSMSYLREIEQLHDAGKAAGLQTGLWVFDRAGGLKRGAMVVVAGRPGMGKSAFATSLVASMCKRGLGGFFASLEMERKEVVERWVANLGSVPYNLVQDPVALGEHHWESINRVLSETSEWALELWCVRGGVTMEDLRIRVLRAQAKRKLDFVLVDYLQLLQGTGKIYERVTANSIALKQLAKEVSAPVIVLAQLNREVERRDSKRPNMSDLRDSGGVEQDADVVALLFREHYYNESADENEAEVIIGKGRHMRRGSQKLQFFGEFQRFADS